MSNTSNIKITTSCIPSATEWSKHYFEQLLRGVQVQRDSCLENIRLGHDCSGAHSFLLKEERRLKSKLTKLEDRGCEHLSTPTRRSVAVSQLEELIAQAEERRQAAFDGTKPYSSWDEHHRALHALGRLNGMLANVLNDSGSLPSIEEIWEASKWKALDV